VFVIFSNHLDIGFTDNINGSCAGAVTNRYFHEYIPKAIDTAQQFREKTTDKTYRWMAHAWLVSMFRHCSSSPGQSINVLGPGAASQLVCPNATQLAAFDAAAKRGDITWHVFPFNAEPEVYNEYMFDASLNLTFAEDKYYGHAPRMTYSQRDVPGLTRAAIPLLSKRGVKGVTVGENGACAPVNVPPIFLWRDNETNTEVVAMFHPKGYGADKEERGRSRYYHSDGSALRLSEDLGDCVTVTDARVALCYAWRDDNLGPHGYDEASAIFSSVQAMYPHANVTASDAFDDFVTEVWPHRASLPVVTAEIGDTWVHGASTDPLRIARFRAASRLAADPQYQSADGVKSKNRLTFERLLTKGEGYETWAVVLCCAISDIRFY
jgi:hypothetical protein